MENTSAISGLPNSSDVVYGPTLHGIVLNIITTIVGLASNLVIIIVYLSSKQLRNPSNAFVINLAVADLALIVTVIPAIHLKVALSGRSLYGDAGCTVYAFFLVLVCGASLYNLGAIAVVRFISIVRPQWKRKYLTWRWCIVGCVAGWVYSALMLVPALVGWGRLTWYPKQFICVYDWTYSKVYNYLVFFLNFISVSVIMTICYIKIYRVFRESRKKLEVVSKRGLSKQQSKRQKHEIKLAIQLLVIYVIYNLCWGPYFMLVLFVDADGSSFPVGVYSILVWLSFLNSAVNVFIYLACNSIFRAECMRILLRRKNGSNKVTQFTVTDAQ